MSTNPESPTRSLPERPNLRHLRDQAKELFKSGATDSLSKAQFLLAREYGFSSWPRLKSHVESIDGIGQQESESAYDVEALRETFRNRGVVRLKGLLPREKVELARRATRNRMEEAGIWQNGSWNVSQLIDAPINEGARFGRRLKGCSEFSELVKDQIPRVVGLLLHGQPTFCGMNVPQPLFTLPNANSWNVPHSNWHLDVPRLPQCGIPGVQIFTFLDSVLPTGGGTLVVAGSHRLLNGSERISSKHLKTRLKKEQYFRELMSKSDDDRRHFVREVRQCGAVEVQVVEMFGEPGDVYFTDLRVLHTTSPNARDVPRVMLTRRYFLTALREAIYGDTPQGGP